METRGKEGVKESIEEDKGDCTMGKAKGGRKGRKKKGR
jgi:hypothetical protein